jgi:maltose O-acetyltransferase
MSLIQKMQIDLKSQEISIQNTLINSIPDSWLGCHVLRPALIRCLGAKLGRQTSLRKGSYYGNVRNIQIGSNTGVNREVFFDAFDKITIGSYVGIGFRVIFNTSTHEMGPSHQRLGRVVGRPIVVEDGVWIGAGAYIGPGVTLGRGCVVSAGAVVMRSVEPNVVVAGSPARVIKRLEDNEIQTVSRLEMCKAR